MTRKMIFLLAGAAAAGQPDLRARHQAADRAADLNLPAAYIAMGIASGLCGLGQGKAAASAAEAMARNPGAQAGIRFALILGSGADRISGAVYAGHHVHRKDSLAPHGAGLEARPSFSSPMKLHGIFPPIATPFNHEGELWKVKVQHNVEKWNLTGLAGYVVCGSTGESVMLTTEEKMQLWEWVAGCAAPEKLLIAGTGMESVRETVALTNRAADIGYKAAMVRTPHYYKNLINNSAAQMLYFRAVADHAKVPLIIYNWPQATGVDIAPEAVAELSHHPNIIAASRKVRAISKK